MIARTESVQNWLENITYQMCNMVRLDLNPQSSRVAKTFRQSYREQANKLAGYVIATSWPIALSHQETSDPLDF